MKKYFILTIYFCSITAASLFAQNTAYQYTLDLKNIKKDKAKMTLKVPHLDDRDSVEFHMPKIVPGTYSIYDFGRFIEDFQAFDARGNALQVEELDVNRWLITNATSLATISYWIDDSFDSELDTIIFEPAGTNFEEGKNYLINTFGCFGYFDGFKRRPFDITVYHPEGFWGATPLKTLVDQDTMDRFFSADYYELSDSPMMYTKPDTISTYLGDTEILVSVYSPNNILSAEEVLKDANKILAAQKAYLDGQLPVDKYVIMVYLFDRMPKSRASGALEHPYSTVLTMREEKASDISESIVQVVAHEFFHIITPLTIHSEEIHDFDFQNPKMSEHLWLYEGLVEYAAGHVLLKEGLIGLDEYLSLIRRKYRTSKRYFNDTLPFTEMSKGCLDEYKDEYSNVYMKGALIGLCLDVKLRSYSKGAYGTQELMRDLTRIYGQDRPFKDEELFDQITSITTPEIGSFLNRYVSGSDLLPIDSVMTLIGVDFKDSIVEEEITLGNVAFGMNPENNRLVVRAVTDINEFGKSIGYEEGDELIRLNGVLINASNFMEEIARFKTSIQPGDPVEILLARYNKKGKEKQKVYIAPALSVSKTKHDVFIPLENPTEKQLEIRKAWGNI